MEQRNVKTVSYSAVRDQVHMVFPNDLNANDTVFGGLIMATTDRLSVVVASRHAGSVCVTAAVDAVVFGLDAEDLKVLLIKRDLEPYAGHWALPGGFVRVGESLDGAVRRELMEETGLERVYLEQLYTFGEPDRDPREHTVSVAYYALVKLTDHKVRAATDARDADAQDARPFLRAFRDLENIAHDAGDDTGAVLGFLRAHGAPGPHGLGDLFATLVRQEGASLRAAAVNSHHQRLHGGKLSGLRQCLSSLRRPWRSDER